MVIALVPCQGNDYNISLGGFSKTATKIGSVRLTINGSELYFCNFVINQEYRNRGYGSLALAKIVDFARLKKCRKVKLLVEADNDLAVGLYIKGGFLRAGKKGKFDVYERDTAL